MDMALSEEQIRYLNHHPPGEAVARALSELLENDHDLLGIDANERSITFRFAMYLQRHFPDWTVDCEYNRDGAEPKTVFPDVIVHRRGTRNNYLVLEFKKSTSRVDRQIDLRKLRGYKQQLGYEHALFVEVGTEGRVVITMLEWA